jgi:hypothetical protein
MYLFIRQVTKYPQKTLQVDHGHDTIQDQKPFVLEISGISDGALIVPVQVIFVLKDADHGMSIGIVVPIGLQGCSLGLASQFQLLLPLGQLQVQHPPQQVGQAVQTIDQTQERYSTGGEKGQRLE